MMTTEDITLVLKMLSANYGEDFYKGTNPKDVIQLWSVQFADDDPEDVMQAVQNCIATLTWRPHIADIRKRMASNATRGQMTPTEAFQQISIAVSKSYDAESGTKQYNNLPPILRKTVGMPSQLISWHNVSDEAFQTVIMSAIRESYKEFAQRQADYHALPEFVRKSEQWRVQAPEQVALPEPEKENTLAELFSEADRKEVEFRIQQGIEPNPEYNERMNDFLIPMTADEKKMIEAREKAKVEKFL